jgi:hypothetical protein
MEDRGLRIEDRKQHGTIGARTNRTLRRIRMLRINGVTKEEAPEGVRAVFEEQEKRYGMILNTGRVYGLRPTIQKGVQALQQGIVESGLIGAELRHLLCMKAASINGCPY